jgi:antitoxin component YwqK of YwqJK toxin-antitoxin module
MIKPLLTFLFLAVFICRANCQATDTLITYFKSNGTIVEELDSADYMRFITKPIGQKLFNVNEYYRNGTPKLIGKTNPDDDRFFLNLVSLQGACITYFPNGRRKSIDNYDKGNKQGESVEYYPTGKVYCIKKYYDTPEPVYLTCYDSTGKQTADKGTGHWLMYDVDFKNIVMEGPVKSGYKNADWQGYITDSVDKKFISKYTVTFRNNFALSNTSYDNEGKKHSFFQSVQPPYPKEGISTFIAHSKKALKISSDADLHNPVRILFKIDVTGNLSDVEIVGDADKILKDQLIIRLQKNKDWLPGKFWGVERGFKMTIPLVEKNGHGMFSYVMLDK